MRGVRRREFRSGLTPIWPPAGMPSEWRCYNEMQIGYPPPEQGPEGLTETERALYYVCPVSSKIRIRSYINDYGPT